MKAQQLYAQFARRREAEQMQIERTQAVNKYYDHWGKVNARYQTWTTPEYYQQAEESLQRRKQKKEKERTLNERREKLTALLEREKRLYEVEMQENQRSKKQKRHSLTTLQKITENLKEQETIRRRLELESKLYSKWRHGVDDDTLVFTESKTDNEVLAKLNWLDKQVEQQLEREKEEKEAQERELRLQEELNKAEQLQKERQQIREQEIREVRSLQEMHMEELKKKESESSLAKAEEQRARKAMDSLLKELELLEESYCALNQPVDYNGAHNLKKIKVFMHRRSSTFQNHIDLCLDILERSAKLMDDNKESLQMLKGKLLRQKEAEVYQLSEIDAMYESEAKSNLKKYEELWLLQASDRYSELKDMLESAAIAKNEQVSESLQKQNELMEAGDKHLNAMECIGDKLKQLIKEEEMATNSCPCSRQATPRGEDEGRKMVSFSPDLIRPDSAASGCKSPELPPQGRRKSALKNNQTGRVGSAGSNTSLLSNSFSNLNLDVWESLESPKQDENVARLNAQRSLHVVTPENVERPKFGRKRVAWT